MQKYKKFVVVDKANKVLFTSDSALECIEFAKKDKDYFYWLTERFLWAQEQMKENK